MSTDELQTFMQRLMKVTADVRALMKYSDRPADTLQAEMVDLERAVASVVNDVQLRELSKYRRKPAAPAQQSDTVRVQRLGLTGARQ